MRAVDRLTPFVDQRIESALEMPSIVFLDTGAIGRFARQFARRGVQVVTFHHNVQKDYNRDARGRQGIVIDRLSWRIVEGNERAAVQESGRNLTFSEHDAERLHALYGGAEASFENIGMFEREDAEPLPCLAKAQSRVGHVPRLVSTGSLCTPQSIDGLTWFLTECLPEVRHTVGAVDYVIAGRSPPERLLRLASAMGVEVKANPASIADVLRDADLYVSPIRAGSGIKLRNMDGLRWGLPVVAHEVSARGYRERVGDSVEAFRTPRECALAIQRQLSVGAAPDRRRAVQNAYLKAFSFESGLSRLDAAIDENRLCSSVSNGWNAASDSGPGR
jgi:glycosyltransferase involved in cell wall biosynthesis